MYFVPLSQLESVELLIHCLRAAAGEADCTMCPVRKVCMKQCLSIANSVEQMLQRGAVPQVGEKGVAEPQPQPDDKGPPPAGKGRFKVIK